MTVTASAPGKIVLSGEYAVLAGAPAVCMAVTRRAVATVTGSVDGECHVTTPGFTGQGSLNIIKAVYGDTLPACTIKLDTRAFSLTGRKIGLGSSAALTVALTAARSNSVNVFADALAAHRRFQGGAGSGIDVAAAVHGGLFEYQMATGSIQALSWPDDLHMRVLWTGVPVSTSAKLERLAEREEHPSRSALGLAAGRMAIAWRGDDAATILSEYPAYISALRQFSVDHKLGIFDAGHDELTDAAMANNLVYKPAGAGGGDIGILFGRDVAELDAFVAQHAEPDQSIVSCELDQDGVRLEPT